jgi:fructosamine-3-kinase
VESICNKLSQLFRDEPPSLLHGDLWNGNFFIASSGNAAIYDPSVYYGHREMDIAMSLLFSGFDERFYSAYHAAHPLERGWRDRVGLAQLYPLLVHMVLYGEHYREFCIKMIKRYA